MTSEKLLPLHRSTLRLISCMDSKSHEDLSGLKALLRALGSAVFSAAQLSEVLGDLRTKSAQLQTSTGFFAVRMQEQIDGTVVKLESNHCRIADNHTLEVEPKIRQRRNSNAQSVKRPRPPIVSTFGHP